MEKDLGKMNFDRLYELFFESGFGKFLDKEPVFEEINGAVFDLARKAYIAGCRYSYEIFTASQSDPETQKQ